MELTLSESDFQDQLAGFTQTAFRLELQPFYVVASEREIFENFLAGSPDPLTDYDGVRAWLAHIRQQVSDGKTIERVRVFDDPPTDYQRFLRWSDRWTREAGETIHYLPRHRAHAIGLLPSAGPSDWWLFDDQRLMVLTYDNEGRRALAHLVTDEAALRQARRWQDLAVSAAQESTVD